MKWCTAKNKRQQFCLSFRIFINMFCHVFRAIVRKQMYINSAVSFYIIML